MAVNCDSVLMGPPDHSSLKLSFNVPTIAESRVTILRLFFSL